MTGACGVAAERRGFESPTGFRFCGACGATLPKAPEPRETRKVVTALFCGVAGSTALGEELDFEALRGVMNRYFKESRATVERHGGMSQAGFHGGFESRTICPRDRRTSANATTTEVPTRAD
jgi:hypothetical protein